MTGFPWEIMKCGISIENWVVDSKLLKHPFINIYRTENRIHTNEFYVSCRNLKCLVFIATFNQYHVVKGSIASILSYIFNLSLNTALYIFYEIKRAPSSSVLVHSTINAGDLHFIMWYQIIAFQFDLMYITPHFTLRQQFEITLYTINKIVKLNKRGKYLH